MEAACAPAAAEAMRQRHKRKGIPRRSPCRRDMVEAPGVVFRFPDKISPGLAILPSAAGLPSGLGSKSAAAVIIAAAAAVSAPAHGLAIHRSASNVLHYPELLSDLRDRLIQVHQAGGGAAGTSSGVESDSSHALQHAAVRRVKPKRPAKTTESFDAGASSRRVRVVRRGESAHPEPFHRRHSIG
ncbi:hypothetical protein IWQ56_002500, partial [Coemansia nantahalensis]